MLAVNEVLSFVGHAILSDQEQEAVDFDIRPGLLTIIACCRTALDAHLPERGVAT
jgi:hypothetical protein